MRFAMTCAAGALLLLAAACSPAQKKEAASGPVALKLATDWRAQAEQGGYYQAVAAGEYAKRGITMTIVPGGPGVNVPQLVASQAVDMGVGSNSFIVLDLVKNKIPARAVAAFMQKDPQVLIAHPDAGITTLADVKGHPVLLGDASITAFWPWLKAKYKYSDNQIRKYNFNNAPFLADKRVVQQGYVTSEPFTIEKEGKLKPLVFLLADNGYAGYASMLIVSDKLIQERPEIVRAVVEATAAGWREYLYGDPKAGDALILKDNPEMTQDVLDQAREKMRSYGIVGDASSTPGAMTDERWADFYTNAYKQAHPEENLDYRTGYTLEFLPGAAAQ
ncbi:MAG: ABC transporter substrate-binding protein [Hyphomonadaceae bacterium]